MNEELKKIKKYYGEEMMHFCRARFSTILEKEGVLFDILVKLFPYDKNIITGLSNAELNSVEHLVFENFKINNTDKELPDLGKSIEELLSEVGYNFYECKTYNDTLKFRKYFQKNEELCTFRDRLRTKNRIVTFAVKTNANQIQRKKVPQRQDEYGTSVMSIQINKVNGAISIKNRYNHTVDNPDATFSNNLEEINPGLTKAFEKRYSIKINNKKSYNDLHSFVLADDGRYYRFNLQNGLLYFCHNNILIYDQSIYKDYSDTGKYLFVDDFIFDLRKSAREHRIVELDREIFPSFDSEDAFRTMHKIVDRIEIKQDKDDPNYKFVFLRNNGEEEPTILTIDSCGNLISYVNPNTKKVEDNFLMCSRRIKNISMVNVKKVKDRFCMIATKLGIIEMPKVQEIGNEFAPFACVKNIYFPVLYKIGYDFIYEPGVRDVVYMPRVIKTGENCLEKSTYIKKLIMDSCTELGDSSFRSVEKIDYLSMNSIKYFWSFNFSKLVELGEFSLNKLEHIDTLAICDINLRERILNRNLTFPQRVKCTLQKIWYN